MEYSLQSIEENLRTFLCSQIDQAHNDYTEASLV